MQYKVHYAGWNNRYDEWVRKDRVVSLVERASVVSPQPPPPAPSVKVMPASYYVDLLYGEIL